MSFDNIWQWSETAASNTAIASTDITGATGKVKDGDNAIRAMMAQIITAEGKGADVSSGGTVTLGEQRYYHITGTTTITDIDFTDAVNGRWAWLVFDGALTLTHNATSLKLPGGANITTAAGDRGLFVQDNSNNVICLAYVPADPVPNTLNGQYKFPATQNASSHPNTLDDYEEGTWTPTVRFGGASTGITYGTRNGIYTKIGNMVTVMGEITLTSKGSSTGAFSLVTLPFAPAQAFGSVPDLGNVSYTGLTAGFALLFSSTTVSARPLTTTGTGSTVAITDANFTNTSVINFSVSYLV